MKKLELEFLLTQKEILNSNSIPSHFIVKGNMVSHLRELAAARGVLLHPEAARSTVEEKLTFLREEALLQVKRGRLKKRLLALKLGKDELKAELDRQLPILPVKDFPIKPLVEHCRVELTVSPPTRRRLDPPNLWPSLKALEDGLTDSGIWPDDDFTHIVETAFRYGGLSDRKGFWKLLITIEEITDLESYRLTPDL